MPGFAMLFLLFQPPTIQGNILWNMHLPVWKCFPILPDPGAISVPGVLNNLSRNMA
jgi:hypothetical protein